VGLEGYGEAEVVDVCGDICVYERKEEAKQRKRWKTNVMSQVAALGVVVCVTILSVGPGVKRLYALDTPQSKNTNILIEIMFTSHVIFTL